MKIDGVCKVGLGFPSGWSSSPRGAILFELCLEQESFTSKTIRSSELKIDTPQGRDKGLVVRKGETSCVLLTGHAVDIVLGI